ncbi:type II secretion system F family protein [Bosea sp. PAMC 26642]|uniref:type II secretion system F family protein n=1 Tax=Bosea sp. (strain PAMC 26642) TaxID=1792307 RepID=UPI001438BCF7|nr:type II secretion system F family protein [Bosea sp. PAMC 26642]
MSEPWLIYTLIFAIVFIGAQLAQSAIRHILQQDRRTAKRFAALDKVARALPDIDVLRKKDSGALGSVLISRLRLLIVQSGTQIAVVRVLLIAAGLWLLLLVIAPLPWSLFNRALSTFLAAGSLVYGYLSLKRSRRIARFGEQLPDIIDVIVRSLRAGHPLPVSLSLVAREMPAPAGPEFAVVVDEITYGRDISGALGQLEQRVGYPEMRFLVASITIAQQTGGNLAEVLARLARMLRERFRLKRKVLALSAEGRFSGYALTSLPVGLFGLIHLVSSTYYLEFWASPVSSTILQIAGALLLIGNVVIYKMVHFKV